MKLQNIIILLLVLSMLLVSATSALAIEVEEDSIVIVDDNEQISNENDEMLPTSVGDVDTIEILAQPKPYTNKYEGEGVIYQTDNFATYYFSNLETNFGNNTIGSCGYVATAMMLSYYDTYLNDGIIDEVFDVLGNLSSLNLAIAHDSPGIRREDDSICSGYVPSVSGTIGDSMIQALDSTGYWSLIDNNYLNYFHLYLIKLAEVHFDMYHNVFVALEENGIIDDTGFPCASTMLMQKQLIEYYLYQVKGLQGQVSLEYTNTDVRDFTINKLKGNGSEDGQPVMLLLGSPNGFHFVVAYDLDEGIEDDLDDDIIYAHYGWREVQNIDGKWKDAMHINIDSDQFPWLVSALAINFEMEHSCSNNYVQNEGTINEKRYCSCYFSSHPAHEHEYSQYNDIEHIYSCNCNFNSDNTEYHNFETFTQFSSTQHSSVCVDCGYEAKRSHTNWGYRSVNNQNHEKYCIDCGHVSGTMMHILKDASTAQYKQCSACKAWVDTSHSIFPTLPPQKTDPEEETE